ncbi:2OG-Fe(II) oxygenase superfamily [Musa troglodytarum]|uniref:2OG-Fe(II) oxygenase superfamily n=1 Tax=Musa troglodytarum TaxID=320322 RepID=A0A9E7KFV4_9LILI|nr:2OG-Fe(II) oxygenase superfamily [Musa troglodytarum]
MNMMNSRFSRHTGLKNEPTPNLFVANCGPAVGMSFDNIESAFGIFGKVVGVHAADETGTRVIVCFSEVNAAQAAFKALNSLPCADLGGRIMHIRYSVLRPLQKVHKDVLFPVSLLASDLGIPGIYLVHDFITVEEEKRLLAEVDNRQWRSLSKRRVQHYGYEFLYETRNVDSKHCLGELPSFVSNILQKILSFPGLGGDQNKEMDQLTVNEYPCGVGLSPHIDTHSAFDEFIFSLSTAGPCIMEFRRYPEGTWCHPTASVNEIHEDSPLLSSNFTRKAIFLPPRSMLLMSGEGRYAWHHYIRHRKVNLLLQVDPVGEKAIRRSSRRVSFTFRKVREGPCCCPYKQYCDSQPECRNQQVKQNIVQSSLPLKRSSLSNRYSPNIKVSNHDYPVTTCVLIGLKIRCTIMKADFYNHLS